MGRGRFTCEQILEYMKRLPQVTVPLLTKELDLSAPTIRRALSDMVNYNILTEVSGQKRDKIYVYRQYLDILEEGSEPLPKI